MPIVYVHGVANRIDQNDQLPGWPEIESYLRQYIAPVISETPENVVTKAPYWGGNAVRFHWNGASRPKSKLLAQGAGGTDEISEQIAQLGVLKQIPATAVAPQSQGSLTSGQRMTSGMPSTFRLSDLSDDQLSDFMCATVEHVSGSAKTKILLDEIAHDPSLRERLRSAPDLDSELGMLQQTIAIGTKAAEGLAGQGSGSWWSSFVDRAREVAVRVNSAPGYAVSRLAMEVRGPVNEAVTTFLGDVFEYVSQKAENPGTIREAVLDALKEAKEATSDQDEPLVVVSHSMGGQVVFDIATNFLGPKLRIDFWAATASQVGLFEEMKLLLASDFLIHGPQRAPFPPNVGWWWNVWDSNDVLSFTARDIFSSQVDDEEWDSGASLAAAHSAYLRRPSFYRKLAEKIKTVGRESRFNRP